MSSGFGTGTAYSHANATSTLPYAATGSTGLNSTYTPIASSSHNITSSASKHKSHTTSTPVTSNSTIPTSSKPKAATTTDTDPSTISGPVWKQSNYTCDQLSYMTPAEQWKAVNGDLVVQTLDQMFSGNQLICPQCWEQYPGQCDSSSEMCKYGLKDLAKPNGTGTPRWDTAAAHFAEDTDVLDLMCQMEGSSECSSPPSCGDCNSPGTWAILKSIETMHNGLQNVYDAIGQAGQYCDTQMQEFSSIFAPVPSIEGEIIFESIMMSLLGAAAALCLPMMAGIAVSTMMEIGASIGMTMQYMNAPSGGDTDTVLGNIIQYMQNQYAAVANALFETGTYKWTSSDGKKSADLSMSTMVSGGALLQASGDSTQFYTALVPVYERILFQQLALYTWQNMQNDDVIHTPFIAFDKGPCDKVDNGDSSTLTGSMTLDVSNLDVNLDFDGNCYYLLDAHPKTQEEARSVITVCNGGNALPGATNKDMTDNKNIFANLSISDFVIPSVLGWQQNNNQNGYPAASSNGQLVDNPQAAGAVNIPVCDYMGSFDKPGVACPKLGGMESKQCEVYPASDGTNQPGDYQPGWCGVHVIQYKKEQMDNDENPLNVYQLQVSMSDGDGRPIGMANKQPDAGTLQIVDTSLPYVFSIAAGNGDDDPIFFWYADQYWNTSTPANKCSVGGYDNGYRQMDCGFNCPWPNGPEPSSATSAHPFPTPLTLAAPAATSFVNTWGLAATDIPTPATPTGTASPTPTYATGKCGIHITQYQSGEGTENPSSDYELEITIQDSNQKVIGATGKEDAPAGKPVPCPGLVGDPLTVTAGPAGGGKTTDDKPLTVKWGSVNFDTGSSQCSVGGYDSGSRNMDCTFSC